MEGGATLAGSVAVPTMVGSCLRQPLTPGAPGQAAAAGTPMKPLGFSLSMM